MVVVLFGHTIKSKQGKISRRVSLTRTEQKVWYGMVHGIWYMVWYGAIRCGMLWNSMVWHGTAWHDMTRHGMLVSSEIKVV